MQAVFQKDFHKIKIPPFCISAGLFLVFLSSGFYIYYLKESPEAYSIDHLPRHYPKDVILQMGGRLTTPEQRVQHFLNFPPVKKKKVIRIGAFGDSHTFGAEVDKTETYPYQLQRLFNKKFPTKKIEILNFGIGGSGFAEQFLLWEKYAADYGLDYILLGPRGFFPYRDTSFQWDGFSYPKTRFIVTKQGGAQKVHIPGDTPKERYENYYSLIPSKTALRYDRNPFQIQERLLPFLINRISNPFYYRKQKSQNQEFAEINTILLNRLQNLHDKKILFFTTYKPTYEIHQSIEKLYNLNYLPFAEQRFYRRFSHESSLGNEQAAIFYFNGLTGNKKFSLKTINCYLKKITPRSHLPKQSNKPNGHLDNLRSVSITDGNTLLLTLRLNSPVEDSYFNRRIKGTRSFIIFMNPSGFLNAPFLPTPVALKAGMKVYIQTTNRNQVKIGAIESLDLHNLLFVFYENYIHDNTAPPWWNWIPLLVLKKMPPFLQSIMQTSRPKALFVENYKLGDLQSYDLFGQESFRLIPSWKKRTFLMMGPSSNRIREKNFPSKFPLYVHYEWDDGKSVKSLIPNWKCRKQKTKIDLKLSNFKPLRFKH